MNDFSWMMDSDEPPEDVVTPLARIRWDGVRFKVIAANPERFVLECSDGTRTRRELERADVGRLVRTKALVIEHGYFKPDGTAEERTGYGDVFAAASLKDQITALSDIDWARELDRDHSAGLVKLYADGREVLPCGAMPLDRWIRLKTSTMDERFRTLMQVATIKKPKRPRKGQPKNGINPPGVTQLKQNLARFRSPDFHPTQFLPKNGKNGGRSQLPEWKRKVLKEVAEELFARGTRFTPAQVRENVATALTLEAGHNVNAPCHETVARFISRLDQGRLMLAQFGFKRTREMRGSNANGPVYTRVGQMVLMDCWKIDLVNLLKKTGIWMHMSAEQRKFWGVRRRVWMCVALDAATRVVLGLAFGLAETPELSARVLRMVVSDKSDIAEATGCTTAPPRPVGIEGLRTDSGVAFTHGFFVARALSLVDHLKVGIVGKPWRNGLIERLWLTTKVQLLPYFSGLTHGNPVARGDFDAMADASAQLEAFGDGVFRFFNDVYRLKGHRGLDKQPPIDRFEETINATGFKKPPNEIVKLVSFGIERELPLTSEGITNLVVQYKAKWLAELFRRGQVKHMRVKIDPCDLGRIAVFHEGRWHVVDGPVEFLGVGATVWERKRREIARRHGAQAAVRYLDVARALADIKDMGARERANAGMIDTTYNDEKLKAEADRIQLHIIYDPTPDQHGASSGITKGAFGKGFATSGNGVAEVSKDSGSLFDASEPLPEIVVTDPLDDVPPASIEQGVDGISSGSHDTGTTPSKPPRPRKAKPAKLPVMLSLADLKKSFE